MAIKVININDMNIKILCFFYLHIPLHVFRPQRDAKEMTVYLFSIYIYSYNYNFIHTWGNFDWSIKVTPSVIKVTPSAIKVTPKLPNGPIWWGNFDWSLIQNRIFSKN